MRAYRWDELDKAAWGDGPWVREPDKVQWVDLATGLDCLARRNPAYGNWCGYVGVPPGHPLHGAEYDDERAERLEVHWGLTFAGACDDGPEEVALCHVPGPGRPAGVWWLGFDCGHAFDYAPGLQAIVKAAARWAGGPWQDLAELPAGDDGRWGPLREVYRDLGFVQRECAALAAQLAPRGALPAGAP